MIAGCGKPDPPPDAAAGLFAQILSVHPDHAAAHHFLGVAQMQQGHVDAAVVSMRKSVRLHRFHASWFQNLAAVEDVLGHTKNAAAARTVAAKLSGRRP
jgi:Flp pilus assembly protein TadD